VNWSRKAGANETVTVGAKQTTTVGAAHSLTVGADSTTTVAGQYSLKVAKQVLIEGDQVVIKAKSSLKLDCSGTTVELTPALLKAISSAIQLNP
jgi:hypothetical protein